GSRQRQVSAWPSAKEKVQPLLCRVAGKLIQVHSGVPKSHQRSGALTPNALCWMLFSCSSINTRALVGPGLRICAVLCQQRWKSESLGSGRTFIYMHMDTLRVREICPWSRTVEV